MDTKRLEKMRQQLASRLPLLGGWLRRRAVRHLGGDTSPQAARLLAETLIRCDDPALHASLREALASMQEPGCQDAVCAVWAESRHPALAEVVTAWYRVAEAPASVRVLTALKLCATRDISLHAAEVAALLAACADRDPSLAAAAQSWIANIQDPATLDLLAEHWAQTRAAEFLPQLVRTNHVPAQPTRLRVLLLLKFDRLDELTSARAEVIEPLLHAGADTDPEIADRARMVLRQLSDAGARDAVCQQVIEADDPIAREAALVADYVPSDTARQALFFFLTDQWDAYDRLDFDRSLLRTAYEAASQEVRLRIAEKARRAGRAELVDIMAGGRQRRRLGRMTRAEWAVTLEVLQGQRAWEQLWALAQSAPPCWGVRALEVLRASAWTPPPKDQASYDELQRLAPDWDEPALGSAEFDRGVLLGHTGPIECLAVRPDGTLLASGARKDSTIRLWSLPGGALVQSFTGHGASVNCLTFSRDGKVLISGSDDQTVRLWRVGEGNRCRTLQGCTGPVTSLALTPDGKTLVSLSRDFVQIWDLTEDEPEGKLPPFSGRLTCLAISPNGEVLAVGSEDSSVRLAYHLPDAELQDRLEGHLGPVSALAFSRDGSTLASASGDGSVRLWSVPRLLTATTLPLRSLPLASPAFHADPHALMAGGNRRMIRLWPLPDGRLLAARARGRTVRLWTPADGRALKTLHSHSAKVTCLAASPASELLISGDAAGRLRLWGLVSRLARLGQTPVTRMSLHDWDWVRSQLKDEGRSGAERRALEFLDVLLRQRWQADVHLEETVARRGDQDILLEGEPA